MRSYVRFLAVDQAVVSATNFLSALLVARLLGLEGFGVFTMALGAALLALSVFSSFVTSPLQVFLPGLSVGRRDSYLRGVRWLGLGVGLLTIASIAIVTALTAAYFDYASPVALAIGVATCALGMSLHDWRRRLWLSQFVARTALLADSVSAVLRFFLLGALWFYGESSVGGVLVCYGVSLLIVLAFSGSMVSGASAQGSKWFGWDSVAAIGVRRHVREGRWLLLNTINFWSGAQLAIYMLGFFFGAAVVGAVNATKSMFGLLNVLFLAMEHGLPQVLRADQARAAALVRSVSLYGGLAAFCVIASVVALSPWVIPFLFGEDFVSAVPFAVWWGAYFLVGFFHRPLIQALRAKGQARSIFAATLAGTVVVAVGAGLLPVLFGVAGVMAALLLSQIVILARLWTSYAKVVA